MLLSFHYISCLTFRFCLWAVTKSYNYQDPVQTLARHRFYGSIRIAADLVQTATSTRLLSPSSGQRRVNFRPTNQLGVWSTVASERCPDVVTSRHCLRIVEWTSLVQRKEANYQRNVLPSKRITKMDISCCKWSIRMDVVGKLREIDE